MILVTGSLAFDYLQDYQHRFSDSLLPEKIANLSVCFLTENLRQYRGGTAGNIAYNLKLYGSEPLIIATAGHNFADYQKEFEKLNISLAQVEILKDVPTASAFITSDKQGNQITMFNPGAMAKAIKKDLKPFKNQISFAIIAPEVPATMLHYIEECQKNQIPYFFDPGQNINIFSKTEFIQAISGAKGIFCNEYEWEIFCKISELTKEETLKKCEMIIITKGAQGVEIITPEKSWQIPAVQAEKVVDPTGCGDAFRGGFLAGLDQGKKLEECAKMGVGAGAACVAQDGTQNHSLDLK